MTGAHPAQQGDHSELATHISKKVGYTKTAANTGAVTLIQRFGGAINLNVHFHMLFLDGVYVGDRKYGSAVRFQWIQPPTSEELTRLTHTIAKRIGGYLEGQGLLLFQRFSAVSHLGSG